MCIVHALTQIEKWTGLTEIDKWSGLTEIGEWTGREMTLTFPGLSSEVQLPSEDQPHKQ